MISLFIKPNYDVSIAINNLISEQSKANNIKDKTNRKSVQSSIVFGINKLKTLHEAKTGKTGLCLFSGSDINDKRIVELIVPPQKVGNQFHCDNHFHVEPILQMLTRDKTAYGYVIIDGNGCLIAVCSNSEKKILQKIDIKLQSKTRRGGQSALRFSRLRDDQRQKYVKKVYEQIIVSYSKYDLTGIFLCGSSNIKQDLKDAMSNNRKLYQKIKGLIDLDCGGEVGLSGALNKTKSFISKFKIMQDNEKLSQFMKDIINDDSKIVFGEKQTLAAFNENVVDSIIVHEDLDIVDYLLEIDHGHIHLISDASELADQFIKGFGGIAGYLKYDWKYYDSDDE